LLDDLCASRLAAGGQPDLAGAKRGVASKRQLRGGREDPDPVIGIGIGGREQKSRFRKVGPVGEGRQLGGGQEVRIADDSERVAAQRLSAEDINLVEWETRHEGSLAELARKLKILLKGVAFHAQKTEFH
jgi:hypothetical protein